jgi:hypothetical protein
MHGATFLFGEQSGVVRKGTLVVRHVEYHVRAGEGFAAAMKFPDFLIDILRVWVLHG